MDIILDKVKRLPHDAGVYIMKDKDNNVIYVGKAKDLKKRVSQYFLRRQDHIKVRKMVENVVDFDFYVVNDEVEALALENNLIKKYKPYYNILLKDSKTYAYIKVNTKEDFPRFEVSRKLKKGEKYFGPYMAGVSAREVLAIMDYAFPLRKCKQPLSMSKKEQKQCLFADMHMCSAPCAKKIDRVDYMKIVDDAIKFLKGDTKKVEQILTEKMNIASENENFEVALQLRERLKMLEKMKSQVITSLGSLVDYDVFKLATSGEFSAMCVLIVRGGKLQGVQTFDILNYLEEEEAYTQFVLQYYSSHPITCDEIILPELDTHEIELFLNNLTTKKITISTPKIDSVKFKLLDMADKNAHLHIEKNLDKTVKQANASIGAMAQLKKDLLLSRDPKRIECYDISHTHGTYTVASMVVLINGEKAPKMYRKFKLETVDFIDDFASMKEVLTRRMEKLKTDDVSFSYMPDLIIIDGGKGQLSVAVEVLSKFNFQNDLISLAKREEEVFKPHESMSYILKRGSYSLRLIQLARNEAHRFAITFNRQLRSKGMYKGGLEAIKGVGPVVRRALLNEFVTIENIKNATLEQLENTKGVSKITAKNIYNYFKTKKVTKN
ncbi:MAG: excinuclease ABC subunit UvrC [Clostridiales bacterium]|nr:excinuclease ABC subunit UvrC [Clostridiales bacterium]